MKRKLTFRLEEIYEDWKVVTPKELLNRKGMNVKVLGQIMIGKPLHLHFKDGYVFKTAGLQTEGFINKLDIDNNLTEVTICTKELGFKLIPINTDFKLNIHE